ncbi:hypothetical protein [Anaerobaca lacustris]|uniref:Uncharacterized protein n=1 Tax=Anaerobaca lacustris TaxID=3044600 RepID=A0AAW6U483_9BACT|nr:hypothetical protein [Sedimentisphaerales bacterium M17dextr]
MGIRTPLIVSGPGFTGGKVVEDLVSLIDLPLTILTAGSKVASSDWYTEDFLYDLEDDPNERDNLVADPQLKTIRAELAAILRRRMVEAGDGRFVSVLCQSLLVSLSWRHLSLTCQPLETLVLTPKNACNSL